MYLFIFFSFYFITLGNQYSFWKNLCIVSDHALTQLYSVSNVSGIDLSAASIRLRLLGVCAGRLAIAFQRTLGNVLLSGASVSVMEPHYLSQTLLLSG